MIRIKVQIDHGHLKETIVAKLIIQLNTNEQIHLTASDEGVIVDKIYKNEVVATGCMDAEMLTSHCQ